MGYGSIGELVRKSIIQYTTGKTTISKYVEFSQYENIEKIDAYLNSKHITGEFDALGREKPFFNIVTGACNIWYRATDIERKNIQIKATDADAYVYAFLATIHLQEWMKKDYIGQFLTEWGRSLARYGSSVTKFVVKKDGLHASVIPWNRFVCDTVDFDANPKIERLFFTPAQLRKNKSYDQDQVTKLIAAAQAARKDLMGNRIDIKNDYIELFEIHGELPLSYLTNKEKDDDEYVQQMQVISYLMGNEGQYEEYVLLKGREARDPYMISHLIKEEGRTQSIGAVEHLFEAQWMNNYSVKAIKDQLDIASKIIFQTSDGSFVGMNALSAIENGDILIHADNAPLTTITNQSHDITSLQSFGQQWQVLAQEITSTPDAISGANLPAGTAYKAAQMQNQESHSLFEVMQKNKGLYLEEMMRKFIIPYLKTKMNSSKQIAATLEQHQVTQLDSMYVQAEAVRRKNAHIKKHMFMKNGKGGQIAPPFDMQGAMADIQNEVGQTGNTRFIKVSDISTKTWADLFQNMEWEVEVEITDEQSDKAAVMTTLSTVLQTVASNPQILQDPNMKLLFNRILEATGSVSPIELTSPPPVKQSAPTSKPPMTQINYKDLDPSLKPQLAAQAGLQTQQAPAGGSAPTQTPTTTPSVGGGTGLPAKKTKNGK